MGWIEGYIKYTVKYEKYMYIYGEIYGMDWEIWEMDKNRYGINGNEKKLKKMKNIK